MRLAAYQFAVCGELDHNLEIVKKTVIQAAENRVDLIVFPECALTGYPPRDIAGSDSINVNGVSEGIFKVGMCLPAGPCVTDEDVKYIVETIKANL